MAFNVTRCPGCESTFNTNPALLAAAAGKVRCGACLTVFEAQPNFIAAQFADGDEEEVESVFVSSEPDDYFDPSRFLTRGALQEPGAEFPAADSGPGETTATADPVQESTPAPDNAVGGEQAPDFYYPDPESQSEAGSGTGQAADLFADPDTQQQDDPEAETDEDKAAEEGEQSLVHSAADPASEQLDTEAELDSDAVRARALQARFENDEGLEVIPEEHLTALGRVANTLELPLGAQQSWGRSLMLTVLALLLGLLLAAQYLWRYLPLYSLDARLRPLYLFACDYIDCQLPVFEDISAIRSEGLTVRSHPTRGNALVANISFQNTAPFPQPFPILILSFNSASNATIALREFRPEEYLPAQLQSLELMPSRQPVQLSLELIDPGADAVNYTLAFRRP